MKRRRDFGSVTGGGWRHMPEHRGGNLCTISAVLTSCFGAAGDPSPHGLKSKEGPMKAHFYFIASVCRLVLPR